MKLHWVWEGAMSLCATRLWHMPCSKIWLVCLSTPFCSSLSFSTLPSSIRKWASGASQHGLGYLVLLVTDRPYSMVVQHLRQSQSMLMWWNVSHQHYVPLGLGPRVCWTKRIQTHTNKHTHVELKTMQDGKEGVRAEAFELIMRSKEIELQS